MMKGARKIGDHLEGLPKGTVKGHITIIPRSKKGVMSVMKSVQRNLIKESKGETNLNKEFAGDL